MDMQGVASMADCRTVLQPLSMAQLPWYEQSNMTVMMIQPKGDTARHGRGHLVKEAM